MYRSRKCVLRSVSSLPRHRGSCDCSLLFAPLKGSLRGEPVFWNTRMLACPWASMGDSVGEGGGPAGGSPRTWWGGRPGVVLFSSCSKGVTWMTPRVPFVKPALLGSRCQEPGEVGVRQHPHLVWALGHRECTVYMGGARPGRSIYSSVWQMERWM